MTRSGFIRTVVALGFVAGVLAPVAAQAQNFEMIARLSGANEAPTMVNTGSFGNVTATIDAAAQTGTVTVNVWNLSTGTVGGHIHVGGAGTSGPIIWNLAPINNSSNEFSFTMTITCANLTLRLDQGIRSCDDAFQALLAENTYVNVHSTQFPGGEIRGQLVIDPR